MIDSYGRRIDYLRISVTDRCNLRCCYCRPAQGVALLPRKDILSFEELADVARAAVQRGVSKIRLTGGEPLVRCGIERFVGMLAQLEGLQDLAMTTNGILLSAHAATLAAAGLRRVNVSLDTLDPARYAAMTRGGDVRRVLAGLHAAQRYGLTPIKLNCVVAASSSTRDAEQVADFARREGMEVRFIRRMNLAKGRFTAVAPGEGGDCSCCNRLRLTSNGLLRPCLLSDLGFDVRQLGIDEALSQAIIRKPRTGSFCTSQGMHAIGG